ncbi:MAG: VWA domain-containing protein [Bryobacteraceae bacterium]|jgi:VWFA-related protein
MKSSVRVALPLVICLAAGMLRIAAQQGPDKEGGETVAKPRQKAEKPAETTPEGPKIPSRFDKTKQPLPGGVPSFKSDVIAVSVDVAVLDNKGHFIPNIPRGNFRVLEDNVPQPVIGFNLGEAPMTVTMVIEFSARFQSYWTESWYQTLAASYGFLETLKPEDYVAIRAYDMRTETLCDFTTDKREAYEAMRRLQIPGFSEANLFDAITDTAQRMSDIEGRKAIVLISSGIDTFSKLTFDKTRRIMQEAGVPVYAIGLMQALREYYDSHGAMGPIARLDFLQADNEMRTFAKETGGMAFFPRFYGEFPAIFRAISEALRHQYVLSYSPANQVRDGKFRKIKVELVNPATGQPLPIKDEKGRPIKYQIIAKNGYTAPREVE